MDLDLEHVERMLGLSGVLDAYPKVAIVKYYSNGWSEDDGGLPAYGKGVVYDVDKYSKLAVRGSFRYIMNRKKEELKSMPNFSLLDKNWKEIATVK